MDYVLCPDDGEEWSEEKRKRFDEINDRCSFSPTRNEWPNVKINRENYD
ncbi:MAG: hypothetical protein IKV87_06210 [Methanobrevibacter sp.]|nr:hypothetical protein [Methanobrevibacter sp.]